MTTETKTPGKAGKFIYWISTIWLALGMTSTGLVQLMQMEEGVATMAELRYPHYFLTILGMWKILGVVAVLIPKFPLLKEWAYAGFFFNMTGAIISHLYMESKIMELFGPSLLLVLIIVSWYFRPESRKIMYDKFGFNN